MNLTIREDALQRGITRLCHFTKSSNLSHILATGELRSVTQLMAEIDGFRPSDTQRFDGHPDRICCSIEYPNAWYLDRARAEDPNFPDWVILVLPPDLLWAPGSKYTPHNAARGWGSAVVAGWQGYQQLFQIEVRGQRTFRREKGHPDWWPTDDQAEVLLAAPVPLSGVQAVIVPDEAQANREHARARHNQQAHLLPPLIIAPVLFDKYQLSRAVRSGRRPAERLLPFVAE